MSDDRAGEITVLLHQVRDGVAGAADRLWALVYDELRRLAHARSYSSSPADAEPTTLVHEVYLRLFRDEQPSWENRRHFFFTASRAMRDILVERARREAALKRGGGKKRLELHDDIPFKSDAVDIEALHTALQRLEQTHPDAAQVVMLRFFGGLTREDAAEALGWTPAAVWREWNFAKAWLLAELNQ